jgi:acyl transferase domain-containing protein
MSVEGIAIVGMAGRFPGARDVGAFWQNIRNGVESITHFSREDLEIAAPASSADDRLSRYVCAKGVLDDIDMFDARFFGYLPREAELMDPQHRVFLELCWEALERGGYDAQRYTGLVGVYGGCYMDSYLLWNLCSSREFLARFVDSIQVGSLQTELGNDKDYFATRVAFKLGLRGPAMTVQTACSTSLVSIATACHSLDSFQCDMALAGGVTIVLPQRKGYLYKEGGMLSPDGHCRPFDEQAAGTVFSNGAAVLLLKRASDAVADGDTIYAVIRGYAMNNDGGTKVSYTAPSVEGQAEVISLALGMADIDPRTIGYVEAHGTATPIGDPIEIAGLSSAYRARTADTEFCAIGSVKANLGHLDVASGAIGVIKTAMAIHHRELPPSINFTRPNPRIDFASSPFFVNTSLKPWPEAAWPRRAGVSSFGVGGTNAHVVLEQAPESLATGLARGRQLLILSARSEIALAAQAERLAQFLESSPEIVMEDAAYTLQVGRREFEHRRIAVVADRAAAVAALRAPANPADTGRPEVNRPSVVFMFPGQGAQYPGMGRELYYAEPVFREVVDRCATTLLSDPECGIDIRDYLLWAEGVSTITAESASRELAQTKLAQPAIFVLEVALARLLSSWGITPATLIGHSVGEFAAACVAGVFALEDAARLVAARGRLMQEQPAGSMLAARAPVDRVTALLPPDLSIAAVNSPGVTIVSGPTELITTFAATLGRENIQTSLLVTSHAYHSSMMAPVAGPLVERVASTMRREATVGIVSTSLGRVATGAELADPSYWGQQLLSPVLFADAVALSASGQQIFLEVGPGQVLSTLARQTLGAQGKSLIVSALGPVQAPGSDVEHLLTAVGRTWVAGAAPDWMRVQTGTRRRIPLPTYPFERKRFWVEPSPLTVESRPRDAAAPAIAAPSGESAMTAAASGDGAVPKDIEEFLQKQLALMAEQIKTFMPGA